MITFLSETILHVQLLTITDLRGAVDEERLEGFYFAGIKLSTAIVECLTIGIKLMTSNFESTLVSSLLMLIDRISEYRVNSCEEQRERPKSCCRPNKSR